MRNFKQRLHHSPLPLHPVKLQGRSTQGASLAQHEESVELNLLLDLVPRVTVAGRRHREFH